MPWLAPRQRETLVLAFIITFAAHAVPQWLSQQLRLAEWFGHFAIKNDAQALELWSGVSDSLCLLFGLLLVAPHPRQYGLCIGTIRPNWRRVLLVIGGPSLVSASVAPFLTLPKFQVSLWLISPLAQDLVFSGYLYTHLERAFPGPLHARVHIHRAVLWTAFFFMLWHMPNFACWPWTFVLLQLAYTFAGALIVGLTRQWTGSIWYVTIAHTIGNFGAWCLSQSSCFPLRL